jgi:glutaredoxin
MKLYICWGLFRSPRPGGHPCKNAHDALKEAGHNPQVVKSYGLGVLPDFMNQTSGRKEVKKLTGSTWVPALVTDDDQVIQGSREIADWAKNNPAGQAAAG